MMFYAFLGDIDVPVGLISYSHFQRFVCACSATSFDLRVQFRGSCVRDGELMDFVPLQYEHYRSFTSTKF